MLRVSSSSFVGLALLVTKIVADGNYQSNKWLITKRFDTSSCSGLPSFVIATPGCGPGEAYYEKCSADNFTKASADSEMPQIYYWYDCVDDATSSLSEAYGEAPFLHIDYYADPNCSEFNAADFYAADGECHDFLSGDINVHSAASWRITLDANGSISHRTFSDFNCSGEATEDHLYSGEQLEASSCSSGTIASKSLEVFSSTSDSNSTSSSRSSSGKGGGSESSSGSTAKFAFVCAAFVIVVILLAI